MTANLPGAANACCWPEKARSRLPGWSGREATPTEQEGGQANEADETEADDRVQKQNCAETGGIRPSRQKEMTARITLPSRTQQEARERSESLSAGLE
jgi:hypothetical protein